jgi:hypothetical protein
MMIGQSVQAADFARSPEPGGMHRPARELLQSHIDVPASELW